MNTFYNMIKLFFIKDIDLTSELLGIKDSLRRLGIWILLILLFIKLPYELGWLLNVKHSFSALLTQ